MAASAPDWNAEASKVLVSTLVAVSTLFVEVKALISNSGVEKVLVCKAEVESIILFVSNSVFVDSKLPKLKAGVALKSLMVSKAGVLSILTFPNSEELYVSSFILVVKALLLISKEVAESNWVFVKGSEDSKLFMS